MSNCSKHQDITIEDIQKQTSQKLQASTWKVKTVLRDGVDITTDYANFTLTIAATTYSTTHGNLAWPPSGTWAFQGQSTTTVVRDGTIPVDFELSKDASSLKLNFTIETSTYANGKVNGLTGAYEFDLTR
jgi:hypothetical protein